ncbi:MAG TPA: ADOP family duplicated permease [Gemmatimonadaceae bacterium]|nr:ADOP family duplicated permease [Gemmatimonadaceae bacterium]
MSTLAQDLRFALRQIRRAPALTAVVVAVLAVGIGANTALVTVVEAIVRRPPPGVRDARDVAALALRGAPLGRSLSYEQFLQFQGRRDLFAAVAAARPVTVALQTPDATEPRPAMLVSSAYFAVLRPRLVLGTGLAAGDDRRTDAPPHAVISHGLWMRAFGGRDDVVGQSIGANGLTFTIVGVAPPRFVGHETTENWPDVWLPLALRERLFPPDSPMGDVRNWQSWDVVARLAPGIPMARAQAAAALLAGQMQEELRQQGTRVSLRAVLVPLSAIGTDDPRDVYLTVGLLGGVLSGLLLLVACANASGLLLARGVARRREIAVKLAVGASRGRIARQLLVENVLVALLAGLVGAVLVVLLARAFERAFAFPIDLAPRGGTFAITAGVAALAGVLFGMMPALHATRTSVFEALRTGGPSTDAARARLQRAFAVAQVTLGLPVLTAAALFATAFRDTPTGSAGFDAGRDALGVTLSLALTNYPEARIAALIDEARDRVGALPGVRSVALTGSAPFFGGSGARALWLPPGDPGISRALEGIREGQRVSTSIPAAGTPVDPEYFRALGIPLRRGRGIEDGDVPGAPLVAVVSEDFAERTWPGLDPVGRTLRTGRSRDSVVTIVGMVGTVQARAGSGGGNRAVYLAWRQFPGSSATLVVRTAGDATPLLPVVRRELRGLDPALPLRDLATFEARREALREDDLREARPVLLVTYGGAALALALACLGVYALLAFHVAQRAREIAIRMALGARGADVRGLFLRQGLRLALSGLVIGIPFSLAARLVVEETLGEVRLTAENALAVTGVVLLLLITAAAASWMPARRAAAVDPFRLLREE